jgi:nucleotide-binding universal stress UspA family protein
MICTITFPASAARLLNFIGQGGTCRTLEVIVRALFKHIMVPLDFTAKNEAALDVAFDLAKQNKSRVTLMHVVETIDYADDEEIASFYETLKNKAKVQLTILGQRFSDEGISLQEKVVLGKRARGIVAYAMRKKVDLIVLSSHKLRPDDEPQHWATLSYQVAFMCQCPVLLVK